MSMDQADSEAEGDDDDDDGEEFADDESFASVDDLDGTFFKRLTVHCKHGTADEGAAHMHELSKLAEKDPEFYKYLQENDQELLEFDPEGAADDEDDEEEDVEMESETLPILTKDILRGWQKALLDVRPPCIDPGFH